MSAKPAFRTEVTTHPCAVCNRRVPWRLLMCGDHWRLVPADQQLAVYRTWARVNHTKGMNRVHMQNLFDAYEKARDAAIAAARAAMKEGA